MTRIRIDTGARLHLGLLDIQAPFGGVGLMIEEPATTVRFDPAPGFRADPSIKHRAYPIAERLCRRFGLKALPSVAISVPQAAPPHSGFGSGTQLSIAIAEGLGHFVGQTLSQETLACEIAQRGKRSAIGVHGYFCGGLLYEDCTGFEGLAGFDGCGDFEDCSGDSRRLNPVVRRIELPRQWRLAIFTPQEETRSVCGDNEKERFSGLTRNPEMTASLRRHVEQRLVPAADAGNFIEFVGAVASYNHDAGMLFADVQGGPYNGPVVSELIESIRAEGGEGVGQSSWGPSVFAWCESPESADTLTQKFRSDGVQTRIAQLKTQGRSLVIEDGS